MRDRRTVHKLLAGVTATALLLMLCSGCGNTDGADDTNPDNAVNGITDGSKEEESDLPVLPLPTSYANAEELAVSDAWGNCNDAQLASVMTRAQQGEPITVACIGGSITQGTIAKGSMDDQVEQVRPYADIFHEWWTERFPQSEITFVNAGIGGTDSYLGLHRANRDVLAAHPDVVLVEFSVNDADSNFYKCSYENLIRKLLLSEDAPAVMLLYMAQTNGATAQNSHVLVGFHYNLPMVSYGNCMHEMMDQGHYTAEELSGDEVHPSGLGHAVVGEILWNYLNQVYSDRETLAGQSFELADVLTKDKYPDADLWDSDSLTPEDLGTFVENRAVEQFPNGWMTEEGEGGITFTAEFRNLGVLYLKTTDGKSGDYEVWVDGEYAHTIRADFTGGWGNAITAEEVYVSEETAEHTVVIKKAENSEQEKLVLLGLLPS